MESSLRKYSSISCVLVQFLSHFIWCRRKFATLWSRILSIWISRWSSRITNVLAVFIRWQVFFFLLLSFSLNCPPYSATKRFLPFATSKGAGPHTISSLKYLLGKERRWRRMGYSNMTARNSTHHLRRHRHLHYHHCRLHLCHHLGHRDQGRGREMDQRLSRRKSLTMSATSRMN